MRLGSGLCLAVEAKTPVSQAWVESPDHAVWFVQDNLRLGPPRSGYRNSAMPGTKRSSQGGRLLAAGCVGEYGAKTCCVTVCEGSLARMTGCFLQVGTASDPRLWAIRDRAGRSGRRVSLNCKMHQGQRRDASRRGNASMITLGHDRKAQQCGRLLTLPGRSQRVDGSVRLSCEPALVTQLQAAGRQHFRLRKDLPGQGAERSSVVFVSLLSRPGRGTAPGELLAGSWGQRGVQVCRWLGSRLGPSLAATCHQMLRP
jgi:hypothetical protein